MRALACLFAAAMLAGCAATGPAPDPRYKPLSAYAKDPFAPVNVYINSDAQLSSRDAAVTEYLAQRFAGSGAFLRADRGVQRWVYTVQLRYHVEPGWGAGDLALRALCALTLGLVPVPVSQTHRLTAEIFLEPDPVGRVSYEETVRDRVSLYDLADPNRVERAVAERMLERLAAELAHRKLLPAARDPAPPSRKSRRKSQPL